MNNISYASPLLLSQSMQIQENMYKYGNIGNIGGLRNLENIGNAHGAHINEMR